VKSVHSTDPRKPYIMDALKKESGGNKVTCIRELGDGYFKGNCMSGNRSGYEKLGIFTVKMDFTGMEFPDEKV
jgi:hypothetical protein